MKIFEKAFQVAEIARYTPAERRGYEESLKVYRDLINVVDTARQKGLKKGEEKGIKKGMMIGMEKGREEGEQKKAEEVVRKAIAQGLSVKMIILLTGLSADEIKSLRE